MFLRELAVNTTAIRWGQGLVSTLVRASQTTVSPRDLQSGVSALSAALMSVGVQPIDGREAVTAPAEMTPTPGKLRIRRAVMQSVRRRRHLFFRRQILQNLLDLEAHAVFPGTRSQCRQHLRKQISHFRPEATLLRNRVVANMVRGRSPAPGGLSHSRACSLSWRRPRRHAAGDGRGLRPAFVRVRYTRSRSSVREHAHRGLIFRSTVPAPLVRPVCCRRW